MTNITTIKIFLRNVLLLMCIPLAGSCSATTVSETFLVGSTPGDEPIKAMLSIPASTPVDFIKWNLKLSSTNSFVLDITYGESQPNTLGFKSGGQTHTFRGSFVVDKSPANKSFKEVYQLKSNNFQQTISLVKVNENLFHILTSHHQLMIGNGGWSYSLNRKNPVQSDKVLITSTVSDEKTLQLVFDGRTPCQEISAEHPEMKASKSCFKLKWKLILNRDSMTYQPTTCTIRKVVDNKPQDVSCKWNIIRGATEHPDLVIYKIEADQPGNPISLLAGDGHVLFFLDAKGNPFIGNENFSFTLNKRTEK